RGTEICGSGPPSPLTKSAVQSVESCSQSIIRTSDGGTRSLRSCRATARQLSKSGLKVISRIRLSIYSLANKKRILFYSPHCTTNQQPRPQKSGPGGLGYSGQ